MAPLRNAIDLGDRCILGVGPELNANVTVYRDGTCTTSPHVGNVRNPATFAYLEETIGKIGSLLDAHYDVIAHDLHPQFLSTRLAARLAEESGAVLVPVQHHRAHITAVTREECIGIAIDGVGYGDDGTVWGGEVFAGRAPDFKRIASLEPVPMPGGDLATRFPERMLYGILPEEEILSLLSSRGWSGVELKVLKKQVTSGFNVAATSSTGRVLDAASALLGICRERTYDGEPAMKLESAAVGGKPEVWDLVTTRRGGVELLSSRALVEAALARLQEAPDANRRIIRDIAASFQFNLARGIAQLAIGAAQRSGIGTVALSGGVAYNRMIRETIRQELAKASLDCILNAGYPLGDGCVSYGQCVYAGMLMRQRA
jgi:hydrogenase maturation protein HypF